MVLSAGPFSLCSHIIHILSLWLELSGGWHRSACLASYVSWGFDRQGLGLHPAHWSWFPGGALITPWEEGADPCFHVCS